jgi:hypothetical protein
MLFCDLVLIQVFCQRVDSESLFFDGIGVIVMLFAHLLYLDGKLLSAGYAVVLQEA